MKYLFFDIECAHVPPNSTKICSFGYVLCDSSFNIIEKNDLLINPEIKLYKYYNPDSAVTFAYPAEIFYKSKKYPQVFPKIYRLLTDKNTLCIGHSAFCDATYLINASKQYNLKQIDFMYMDTQKLHNFFTSQCDFPSLTFLCEYYSLPVLRLHKSLDDALMTLNIAKKICSANNKSLTELRHNPEIMGLSFKGKVYDNLNMAFPIGDKQNLTKPGYKIFKKYLSHNLNPENKNLPLENHFFCFDENLEKHNFDKALF